jgi:hypothetical protein
MKLKSDPYNSKQPNKLNESAGSYADYSYWSMEFPEKVLKD